MEKILKEDFSDIRDIPLSGEEWQEYESYKDLPLEKKLDLLERHRQFMFALWRENPQLRKEHERLRKMGY